MKGSRAHTATGHSKPASDNGAGQQGPDDERNHHRQQDCDDMQIVPTPRPDTPCPNPDQDKPPTTNDQPPTMANESSNQPQHGLREIISDGTFWSMPDLELMKVIQHEFPSELDRLKNATFLRNANTPRPASPSIAECLYGQDYAEINRTLVGVLALRWLWNDNYDTFIGSPSPSPEAIRLKRSSFNWLREIFRTGLNDIEDVYTLVTSMIINDLGKDPNLANDYARLQGISISKVNHDMILYHAVQAGMVPALDRLTAPNREVLVTGIRLGSDFNFGQLAQAENAPASLAGLRAMQGYDRAFEMRFMEQVLDLSGAAGHEDWTCARKMIEPIFQSYRNVYDVAHAIMSSQPTTSTSRSRSTSPSTTSSLREAYDIILTRKLDLLHSSGYDRQFNINIPHDRAIMRLFCLGNTTDAQSAELYYLAFTTGIDTETRDTLVHGLNVDGSIAEPAVQPTYLPAMLGKAVNNTQHGTQGEKIKAVTAMLRYLARCLVVEDHVVREKLPKGVTVIERDVRVISGVLDSDAFKTNPGVLDNEDIPESQVANMVAEHSLEG